jgi:hypothetical protein
MAAGVSSPSRPAKEQAREKMFLVPARPAGRFVGTCKEHNFCTGVYAPPRGAGRRHQ